MLPDPHGSPFLRLQLLRKNRSFLHVTWVTNSGRAWEGGRWENAPQQIKRALPDRPQGGLDCKEGQQRAARSVTGLEGMEGAGDGHA